MSAKADIKLTGKWFIGEKKQFVFRLKNALGQPTSAAGMDLRYALMKKPGSAIMLIEKSGDDPAEITVTEDETAGVDDTIIVTINADDGITAGLKAGVAYYHELKNVDPDNEAVLADGYATPNLSGISNT